MVTLAVVGGGDREGKRWRKLTSVCTHRERGRLSCRGLMPHRMLLILRVLCVFLYVHVDICGYIYIYNGYTSIENIFMAY